MSLALDDRMRGDLAYRSSAEGTVRETARRLFGTAYVSVSLAIASVVLLEGAGGWRGTVLALLVMPIAASYAWVTVRSGTRTFVQWRLRRTLRGTRRGLRAISRRYRIVARRSMTPGRDDHVAIGPNGVFVIITCGQGERVTASSRRLFVDGHVPAHDLLADCRMVALRIRARVCNVAGRPLPVHPVLCFARAHVAVGQEVGGVKVVNAARVARMILSTPVAMALSRHEMDVITAALTQRRAGRVRHLTLAVRASEPRARSVRSTSQQPSHTERRLALVHRRTAHPTAQFCPS